MRRRLSQPLQPRAQVALAPTLRAPVLNCRAISVCTSATPGLEGETLGPGLSSRLTVHATSPRGLCLRKLWACFILAGLPALVSQLSFWNVLQVFSVEGKHARILTEEIKHDMDSKNDRETETALGYSPDQE